MRGSARGEDPSVRLAGHADAPAIAEVHRVSRATYYDRPPDPRGSRDEMWATLLRQPDRTTHVAESASNGGAVIGFVSAAPATGDAMELTALYVDPAHVGIGVGATLYDAFAGILVPGQRCVLEVWAGNDRAIGFYRRRRWVATALTRPGPQGHDYVTYILG